MKIVVVGLGYVGLSSAVLLAKHNEVIGVDISKDRVDLLSEKKSPVVDLELSQYLAERKLNLTASTDLVAAVIGADYVIVATPTNYDEKKNFFDTSSVESVIEKVINCAPNAHIVVKSTVPVGFIDGVRKRFCTNAVMFSPEFLREGKALHDNLYPSRIIVGEKSDRAEVFANLLKRAAISEDIDLLFCGTREAEAIKLFANSYLAMRVSFFNELDTYALANEMSSEDIINGVSMDPRIGKHYNNPSFGYGGYCLPKDVKQLLANFGQTPQNIFKAIIDANSTRKSFLTEALTKSKPKTVGIYRLVMKAGSDNFRESSVLGIMERLHRKDVELIVHEPSLSQLSFLGFRMEPDLDKFKNSSDIIVANRISDELLDVRSKVFTRDIFGSD